MIALFFFKECTHTPGEEDDLENREGFSEVWARSWEEYDSGEVLTIWGGQCLETGLGGRLDWYPLQTLVHLSRLWLSTWRCVYRFNCLCKHVYSIQENIYIEKWAVEVLRGNEYRILQWWDSSRIKEGTTVSGAVTRRVTRKEDEMG